LERGSKTLVLAYMMETAHMLEMRKIVDCTMECYSSESLHQGDSSRMLERLNIHGFGLIHYSSGSPQDCGCRRMESIAHSALLNDLVLPHSAHCCLIAACNFALFVLKANRCVVSLVSLHGFPDYSNDDLQASRQAMLPPTLR
jgi:hypothetical protein